ncbi:MAG: TPM domain-containing protein [Archangium sp.]
MVMAGWLVVLAAATDIAPPSSGTWVVDRTGQLSAETKQQVDALANEVADAGVAKIAVLVSDDYVGTPRAFAQGVLKHWQLGADGVLVTILPAARRAEIVFGSGSRWRETLTDDVMTSDVVPNMKAGDLDAAVFSSVRSLHFFAFHPAPPPSLGESLLNCVVGAMICPGLPLSLLYLVLTRRKRRRFCKKCKTERRKLTEAEEDEHLTVEQQREELARVTDYDVWWCPTCNDACVSKWGGSIVDHKNCPMCRETATALTPESVQAQYRGGTVKLSEKCLKCGFQHSWVAVLPERPEGSDFSSSDSSSSSSDSGGGSSGSW